jgi:hypothetical protein
VCSGGYLVNIDSIRLLLGTTSITVSLVVFVVQGRLSNPRINDMKAWHLKMQNEYFSGEILINSESITPNAIFLKIGCHISKKYFAKNISVRFFYCVICPKNGEQTKLSKVWFTFES